MAGRPSVDVDLDALKYMRSIGMQMKDIATLMNVSRQTLYNFIKRSDYSHEFSAYTDISDQDLDESVTRIKTQHPHNGEVMLAGYLAAEGIRVVRSKLRASIHRVDPRGVEARRSKAIKRRVYSTPHPNFVWHIDGNHKLIKWRFVVHGSIDGYSRLITFLNCSTNNRAATVAESFTRAVGIYGVPKHVRSDHGGENVDVWRFMIHHHEDENSVIVGSSTHNVRIERLWRDVRTSVLLPFSDVFQSLEDDEALNPLNDIVFTMCTSH